MKFHITTGRKYFTTEKQIRKAAIYERKRFHRTGAIIGYSEGRAEVLIYLRPLNVKGALWPLNVKYMA